MESESVSNRGKNLARAAVVLAMMVPLTPFDFNLFGIIFPSLITILVGLGIVVAAWLGGRSRRVPGMPPQPSMMPKWLAGLVILVSIGFVIASAATFPGLGPAGTAPGGAGGWAIGMQINPSIDTTVSLPAGSYTACTSLSVLSGNGAKTTTGVVWAAQSGSTGAVYNQGPGNTGAFIQYSGAQGAVTGGGGKMVANCFQLKFVLSYTNVPTASGGGAIGLPIFVYLTSITKSSSGANGNNALVQAFNNGTLVNVPIHFSGVGLADQPFLIKDGAANWQPLCVNYRGVPTQSTTGALTGGCSGYDANLARTTGAITFTVDVIVNTVFGYSTTSGSGDDPIGSSITWTFSMGLPQSQTNAGFLNAYTPTLGVYTLTLTRSIA
jgi:hypothetical protein